MGYSIQNTETGEVDYFRTEDGKIQQIDEETGEPINEKLKVRYTKYKRFKIPKIYLKGTFHDEFEKDQQEKTETPSCTFTKVDEKTEKNQYKRDDYINGMEGVSKDIIMGYNKHNYRLFLIPTLFFFNIYVFLILAILEILLHMASHCKNTLTMNKHIYYRSPLHILTSQHCALCRADSEADFGVFKQMRQAHEALKLDVKDVSKVIS